MFGRRKNRGSGDDALEVDETTDFADEEAAEVDDSPADSSREGGPFDSAEEPSEIQRLDLGGLRIPANEEIQVRVEADPATKTVISATVLLKDGGVQLQAFAAPRTESLWDEVCAEIAASMKYSGSAADEVDGPFGTELHGKVTVPGPDGKKQLVPAVFAGVDGPRWLLRLVFTGAAVSDQAVRSELNDLVRGVVVDRGDEPMAPRALIPLNMPGQAADPWAQPEGESTAGR